MNFRSLLVHLDGDTRSDARVGLAVKLATCLDARLVGVAPTGGLESSWPPQPAGERVGQLSQSLHAEASHNAERFRARCQAVPALSSGAFVDATSTVRAMVDHGHAHDLLLMSLPDPAEAGAARRRRELELVLLETSRPVLVLPDARLRDVPGRTVLIAWNGRREAARAAADALPLLAGAKAVQVVEFRRHVEDDDYEVSNAHAASASAAAQWLRRHRVPAQWRLERTDGRIEDALLARARELDADLIVAGAYGHPRLAEWVLGGVTRGLLDATTVPLLMSR